jgi:hypothetical protein
MTSTSGRTDFPYFRRRWRGYDRNEVDEFLRRTAADRQQLQEDLAHRFSPFPPPMAGLRPHSSKR